MEYDGLDQTGEILITPLLSSQGRVMVGKCDEIGGPYLQVMQTELIDKVKTSPTPISHPKKTFTNKITPYGVYGKRNVIFRILCPLPILENRARAASTYLSESISTAERRLTSISTRIFLPVSVSETAWKSYTQLFKEQLETADKVVTKAVMSIRAEFVNIVLRSPAFVSGITESGKTVMLGALSETGKIVSTITEIGRASFNTFHNYTPSSFWIEVDKTFKHRVDTTITRGNSTFSLSPYIERLKLKQPLTLSLIWLIPYTAGLNIFHRAENSTLLRSCKEHIRAVEKRATRMSTCLPLNISLAERRNLLSWVDINETIKYIESRATVASITFRETLKHTATQWKEYTVAFVSSFLLSDSSARSITTHIAEFINIRLNLPKLLSGLSETGRSIYSNALSETGRITTSVVEDGKTIIASISHTVPPGFTISILYNIRDTINTSHTRAINTLISLKESTNFIDTISLNPLVHLRETLTHLDNTTTHLSKRLKEFITSSDSHISLRVVKPLTQLITSLETRATSLTSHLTESPTISGISNINFSVLLANGIALIDNTHTSLHSYIKETLKLIEHTATSLPYEIREALSISHSHIVRSWIDVVENINTSYSRAVNSIYTIKNTLVPKDKENPHIIPSTYVYGIAFADSARGFATKIFIEPISYIETHVTNTLKPLRQTLRLRDSKLPHISKIIINTLNTSHTHYRSLISIHREIVNAVLSIPKQLSGLTETGYVYMQSAFDDTGRYINNLTETGRTIYNHTISSSQNGFIISITKSLREKATAIPSTTSRSMIQLLEATTLGITNCIRPLKKFVETISTQEISYKQVLHVLHEYSALLMHRQSQVTSSVVHRLDIVSGEVADITKSFFNSISSSEGFLRRPQKMLTERALPLQKISQTLTTYFSEQLRAVEAIATSPLKYMSERIIHSDTFKHRLAGLITRPYTTAKAVSKATKTRTSKSFATLKSYLKNTEVAHQGDNK